jgi:hypothetical protein
MEAILHGHERFEAELRAVGKMATPGACSRMRRPAGSDSG